MSTNHYKIEVETKTFIRFWLVILGFAAAGFILYKAMTGLFILGAALFLAIAISPLVNKLANIIPGEGRKLPIALSYLLVVGFLVAFVSIVSPVVIDQSIKFAKNLPSIIESTPITSNSINEFGNTIGIDNLRGQLIHAIQNFSSDFVANIGNHLMTSIGALGDFISKLILVLMLALFILIEGPDILHQFWSNFRTNNRIMRAKRIFERMSKVITKYVSNAITVAFINATATALTVFILSQIFKFSADLALPFGLITGAFSLIPMFGSIIGGSIVAILLAFNALPAGIVFFIYTVIYLQVEANFISPKIQGKGLQLPALVVLASVTLGVYTFGLVGAIISIPIAGCIKVLLEEYGDGFLPTERHKRKHRAYQLIAPLRRRTSTEAIVQKSTDELNEVVDYMTEKKAKPDSTKK